MNGSPRDGIFTTFPVGSLRPGMEIIVPRYKGTSPQDYHRIDIVAAVDGNSALLASGICLRGCEGDVAVPTGRVFDQGDYELSLEAKRILAETSTRY